MKQVQFGIQQREKGFSIPQSSRDTNFPCAKVSSVSFWSKLVLFDVPDVFYLHNQI